jgi:hypothetical protein
MAAGIIAGSVWFALFLLGNAMILRLAPPAATARANQWVFIAGLVGIPVSLALTAIVQAPPLPPEELAAAALCGVLLFGGLFVLYMPFYYVVMTSLSVRMAVLLSRQPGGALPLQALQDRFASRQLVGQRLQTMVDNGFLRPTPQGYALTDKGRAIAQLFDFFKRFWNLGSGG